MYVQCTYLSTFKFLKVVGYMKSSWIGSSNLFPADLFDDYFFQILSLVMIDLQKEYLILMYISKLLKMWYI